MATGVLLLDTLEMRVPSSGDIILTTILEKRALPHLNMLLRPGKGFNWKYSVVVAVLNSWTLFFILIENCVFRIHV